MNFNDKFFIHWLDFCNWILIQDGNIEIKKDDVYISNMHITYLMYKYPMDGLSMRVAEEVIDTFHGWSSNNGSDGNLFDQVNLLVKGRTIPALIDTQSSIKESYKYIDMQLWILNEYKRYINHER